MSWKMHFLTSTTLGADVKKAINSKLTELGFSYSYDSDLIITIDGVAYSGKVTATYNGTTNFYLFVNDETNDVLITASTGKTSALSNSICYAILSGRNPLDGTRGLFPIANTDIAAHYMASSGAGSPTTHVMLRKVVFYEYPNYNAYNFESSIYYGSIAQSPGIVISVGSDYFVCLAGYYYAKL